MSNKTYTSKEAVELLKQGKKIRSDFWSNGEYVILHNDGRVITHKGHEYNSSLHMFEGYYPNATWIEVKEKVIVSKQIYTTSQALELMKQGKEIQTSGWESDYFYRIKGSFIVNTHNDIMFENINDFLMLYDENTYWEERVEIEDSSFDNKVNVIEKPCPCCKCHSMDDYNSKGKDGKWYCYKHCSY